MKKVGLLMALWGISLCGMAQNNSGSQEIAKKKIKELKLSEQYYYAEAVVPSNKSEAEQNAKDLLNIRIAGVLTGEYNMKKREADKLWNSVVEKCESISVTTGILHKAFTYLPKSLIIQDQEEKKNTQKPVIEKKPSFDICSKSISDKDKNFINKLVAFSNFKEAIAFLERTKQEQIANYGSLQTCKTFDKVFLVIFKEGKLDTILGTGGEKRENLKTGAQDSIMDYMGYSIIWFQIL